LKGFLERANDKITEQNVPYTEMPFTKRKFYREMVMETVEEALAECTRTHNLTIRWSALDDPSGMSMMPTLAINAAADRHDDIEFALRPCKQLLHTRGLHLRLTRTKDALLGRLIDMYLMVDHTVIHGKVVHNPYTVLANITKAGWVHNVNPFWVVKMDGMFHNLERHEEGPKGLVGVSAWQFMIDYALSRYNVRLLTHWNDHRHKETMAAYIPGYMKSDSPIFEDDVRYLLACNNKDLRYLSSRAPENIRDQARPVIQGLRFSKTIGDFIQHCKCSGIGTDFIPAEYQLSSAANYNITKDLEAAILWTAMVGPTLTTLDQRIIEASRLTVDMETGSWTTGAPVDDSPVEPLFNLIRNYERATKLKFFKE